MTIPKFQRYDINTWNTNGTNSWNINLQKPTLAQPSIDNDTNLFQWAREREAKQALNNSSLFLSNPSLSQNTSPFSNPSGLLIDDDFKSKNSLLFGDGKLTANKKPVTPSGGGANWGNLNVGAVVAGGIGMAESMSSSFNDLKNTEVQHDTPIDVSGANDYDTLQDFSNSITRRKIGFTEVGGHTTGQSWKNVGKGAGAGAGVGATIGSVVGPIGTVVGGAIGAVVGGAGTAIAEAFGRRKAKNKQLAEQQKADELYNIQENNMANQANNIALNEIANQQWEHITALGGNLHSNSTTWSNGLNYIGAGGSHESNPNDGVAISTAPDGLQNKVEEGEVVWDNEYVFSKRLKVPESIKKKNKWKGNTFADVAKELMENSEERPNDPIALRGLDDSLSRLRDTQDELKAKQEERKIKKEIASMPPEMLAQLQQQAQQPTEEEMAQQTAMEQQQMPMADLSMQQPMMQQPPLYAEGGHLFEPGGPSIKAVSGKNFFAPVAQRALTGLNLDNSGNVSTTHEYQTPESLEAERQQDLLKYINRQTDYVNVRDAQRYGGFYNIDQINKREFLNGSTPMDVKNRAEGIGNQQDWENGIGYYNRYAVQENNKLNSLATSPKDIKFNENAYVLDKNNPESVNFFKKKNPNLNLDSDTIYFYSKNKNDVKDKNKFVNTNKISQEVYNKNNIDNIIEMSGINFNKLKNYSKGGYLYYDGSELLRSNLSNDEYPTYLLNPYINRDYSLSALSAIKPTALETQKAELIRPTYTAEEMAARQAQIDKLQKKKDHQLKKDNFKENIKEYFKNWDETDLRYFPVLGHTWQMLRDFGRHPDYSNPKAIERAAARVAAPVSAERIGDYLQYRPLDDTYYLNQLNAQQNAANNNIIGLSNGNRSMALASMLSNDYNYNNQRGAAYRQGAEYNDVNRLRFGEFNRGTNQFNAQQALQASLANAQNRANAANLSVAAAQMRENIDNAFGASKSANLTNLFNSIGDIGRDRMNWNMVKDIYDYHVGRNGEVKYKNAAKGGYLTIKTKNRRIE